MVETESNEVKSAKFESNLINLFSLFFTFAKLSFIFLAIYYYKIIIYFGLVGVWLCGVIILDLINLYNCLFLLISINFKCINRNINF